MACANRRPTMLVRAPMENLGPTGGGWYSSPPGPPWVSAAKKTARRTTNRKFRCTGDSDDWERQGRDR